MWWFWVRSAWLQVFSLTFVVLQSGKSRSRGFTPAPCGSPIKCLKMHMRTPTALSSKLWQSRWLLRWGCSTATACRKHTHTLCGKVFCIVLFFLNSVILLCFSAQNHLFQKSTVGQMLRWFHCPGFQVSELSGAAIIKCFLFYYCTLKHPRDEIVMSRLSSFLSRVSQWR